MMVSEIVKLSSATDAYHNQQASHPGAKIDDEMQSVSIYSKNHEQNHEA